MKIVFSILFCSLVLASIVVAQSETPAKDAFSVDVVNPPVTQKGDANYLLSLTSQDFKSRNYIFYTDSNATVAHIRINGNDIRLTGGPNAEHIMAYACKGYTITLSINKTVDSGKMEGMLAIYNSLGQVVGKKVIGVRGKRAGN